MVLLDDPKVATPPYSISKGLRKGIGVIALTALSAICVSFADQKVWESVITAPNAIFLIPILAGLFRLVSNYLKVKLLG